MDDQFIYISTKQFLVLPNEDAELFNPGMYGSALSKYLADKLEKSGYTTDYYNEDWGWEVAADKNGLSLYLGVYCISETSLPTMEFVVTARTEKRKRREGPWWKFKSVSIIPELTQFQDDIQHVLQGAPKTTIISVTDDMSD